MKPLGVKSYGSIPHLPFSRKTPRDKNCGNGLNKILTIKKKSHAQEIIVQEKLDGSNVSVAKINNKIIPLVRSGYVANTSQYKQHQLFYDWVMINYQRFNEVLFESERLCGEWLIQAHGTKYKLHHEPFVVFDIIKNQIRMNYDELVNRIGNKFILAKLLHKGEPVNISSILKILGDYGHHGAIDFVEGAVWRVENNGQFQALAKFVRPEKIDGIYLEKQSKKKPIWNVDIKELLI